VKFADPQVGWIIGYRTMTYTTTEERSGHRVPSPSQRELTPFASLGVSMATRSVTTVCVSLSRCACYLYIEGNAGRTDDAEQLSQVTAVLYGNVSGTSVAFEA
jgi:hypothetical protein